ncbi:MAG: BrnT family toxin [Magnetococcales bacterium]|nr:BrnT family toxin [Magnetococcales bacterium]
MDIEFDPTKAAANRKKHGVSFQEAATVLDDPMAVVSEDSSHPEHRFQAIGASATGGILAVVFTYRGQRCRIISARQAERWERRLYEERP